MADEQTAARRAENGLVAAMSIPPADCTNNCGLGPCDCSGKWRVQAYSAESVDALVAELARATDALREARKFVRLGGPLSLEDRIELVGILSAALAASPERTRRS